MDINLAFSVEMVLLKINFAGLRWTCIIRVQEFVASNCHLYTLWSSFFGRWLREVAILSKGDWSLWIKNIVCVPWYHIYHQLNSPIYWRGTYSKCHGIFLLEEYQMFLFASDFIEDVLYSWHKEHVWWIWCLLLQQMGKSILMRTFIPCIIMMEVLRWVVVTLGIGVGYCVGITHGCGEHGDSTLKTLGQMLSWTLMWKWGWWHHPQNLCRGCTFSNCASWSKKNCL